MLIPVRMISWRAVYITGIIWYYTVFVTMFVDFKTGYEST